MENSRARFPNAPIFGLLGEPIFGLLGEPIFGLLGEQSLLLPTGFCLLNSFFCLLAAE